MTASEKDQMLCCAASFVIATYAKVRLIPHDLRALPLVLFAKPSGDESERLRQLVKGEFFNNPFEDEWVFSTVCNSTVSRNGR
jgi:hypothetical protein